MFEYTHVWSNMCPSDHFKEAIMFISWQDLCWFIIGSPCKWVEKPSTNGCCWVVNDCVPNCDCHWWRGFRFPMIHDDLKQDPGFLSHHYHASRIPSSHPPNIIRWASVSKDHFIPLITAQTFFLTSFWCMVEIVWEEIFLATSIISPWWCLFLVSNVGLWLRSSLVMVKTFQSHNYLSSLTG